MSSQYYWWYGNSAGCEMNVYYQKNDDGTASFWLDYVGWRSAYWNSTSKKYVFHGNSNGYVQMGVDGNYTGTYTYAGAVSSGTSASGEGWIQDRSGTSSTITLAGKNTPYTITIWLTGNYTTSGSFEVTYTFTLPIFTNASGTIKAIDKVYTNVGGTIKECEVYTNVNGTIKQLI